MSINWEAGKEALRLHQYILYVYIYVNTYFKFGKSCYN